MTCRHLTPTARTGRSHQKGYIPVVAIMLQLLCRTGPCEGERQRWRYGEPEWGDDLAERHRAEPWGP